MSHASSLGGYVQDALSVAKSHHFAIDAVAVSRGPGSYTGLRIGVSEAKGLCFGLDVPLIAVDTLAVMACAVMFKKDIDEDALLCPMIDARRMEVYSAVYDRALNQVKPVSAEIIDENSYADILTRKPVVFFGNGAGKCRDVITGTMSITSTVYARWPLICWLSLRWLFVIPVLKMSLISSLSISKSSLPRNLKIKSFLTNNRLHGTRRFTLL